MAFCVVEWRLGAVFGCVIPILYSTMEKFEFHHHSITTAGSISAGNTTYINPAPPIRRREPYYHGVIVVLSGPLTCESYKLLSTELDAVDALIDTGAMICMLTSFACLLLYRVNSHESATTILLIRAL